MHVRQLSETLATYVHPSARVQVEADWNLSPIIAGLVGQGCDFTERNRGRGQVAVAPFVELKDDLWSWLGYHEEWADDPGGRGRRLSFRSSSLTIYFGRAHENPKPQMFRAEWAGLARWGGAKDYIFQAPGAGHPHWQFDAIESLKRLDDAEEVAALRELLTGGGDAVSKFQPNGTRASLADSLSDHSLSRIHFASAAAWWKLGEPHAHGPGKPDDIRSWLAGSLAYIAEELGRLV